MRDNYGRRLSCEGMQLRWYARDGLFDVWIGDSNGLFTKAYTVGDEPRLVAIFKHPAVNLGDRLNDERARTMYEHLRKAASIGGSCGEAVEVDDQEFASLFPSLFAFLCLNSFENGDPRERAKVHIFAEGGRWKASLSDGETRASIFVTLDNPGDAFDALEKALCLPRPDWRRWKEGRGKGK